MKIVSILLSSVSILMVLSTLICGFWIRANGAPAESVDFHMKLGAATGVLVLISLVVMIVLALKVS